MPKFIRDSYADVLNPCTGHDYYPWVLDIETMKNMKSADYNKVYYLDTSVDAKLYQYYMEYEEDVEAIHPETMGDGYSESDMPIFVDRTTGEKVENPTPKANQLPTIKTSYLQSIV